MSRGSQETVGHAIARVLGMQVGGGALDWQVLYSISALGMVVGKWWVIFVLFQFCHIIFHVVFTGF